MLKEKKQKVIKILMVVISVLLMYNTWVVFLPGDTIKNTLSQVKKAIEIEEAFNSVRYREFETELLEEVLQEVDASGFSVKNLVELNVKIRHLINDKDTIKLMELIDERGFLDYNLQDFFVELYYYLICIHVLFGITVVLTVATIFEVWLKSTEILGRILFVVQCIFFYMFLLFSLLMNHLLQEILIIPSICCVIAIMCVVPIGKNEKVGQTRNELKIIKTILTIISVVALFMESVVVISQTWTQNFMIIQGDVMEIIGRNRWSSLELFTLFSDIISTLGDTLGDVGVSQGHSIVIIFLFSIHNIVFVAVILCALIVIINLWIGKTIFFEKLYYWLTLGLFSRAFILSGFWIGAKDEVLIAVPTFFSIVGLFCAQPMEYYQTTVLKLIDKRGIHKQKNLETYIEQPLVEGQSIENSWQCVQCNYTNTLNAKFCVKCGCKKGQTLICIYCGNKVEVNSAFCSHCGKKLENGE